MKIRTHRDKLVPSDCCLWGLQGTCEHKLRASTDAGISDGDTAPDARVNVSIDAKQAKGLEIATSSEVVREGNLWLVPSQSSPKKYTVNLFIQRCTCPDYDAHNSKCKHIYAAEYALQRESGASLPIPEKVVKPTYPQDWANYNRSQVNEKSKFKELLYELCRYVENLPRSPGAGRSRLPLREMIFCVVFKVYSTVSGRRFISDLREAQTQGLITKTPHFNSIFNYLELEEMTDCLQQLIGISSLPLTAIDWDFAVDASGFATCQFKRWLSAKYGDAKTMNRKDWVKVHLICGVKTHIVTAVQVTNAHAGDSPRFAPLVEATSINFPIQSVAADKAYSSEKNLKLVLSKGGQPFIPFRSNSTATNRRSGSVWRRLYLQYQYNQEEFLRHYHKRSNVESTFSMIKAKFGDRLRSKTEVAQINEVLCKVLCHNICCLIQSMYELGLDVDFNAQSITSEAH